MTTKRICYTQPDGSVMVHEPAEKARQEGETEADFLARVQKRVVPGDATSIHICDASELPYRGQLRNAWRQAGKAVPHVDMTEARAIKMAAIRKERDRRLVETDSVFIRAWSVDDQAELGRVKALKQQLRDIPQTVDLTGIAEPDTLDRFEPEWPQ